MDRADDLILFVRIPEEIVTKEFSIGVTKAVTNPVTSSFNLVEVAGYLEAGKVSRKILQAATLPAGDLDRAVRTLGNGQEHTAQDTVPFALWCAAYHLDNFEAALWWTVSGLGNRDATCAIVGGIVAPAARSIPTEWVRRREPLPHSFALVRSGEPGRTGRLILPAPGVPWPLEPDRPAEQNGLPTIRVDPLTGVPNLLGLLDWLEGQQEAGASIPFSLLAIQLPALWKMNRTRGRTAGDELLRKFAEALQARCPGRTFRAGGDKFVVLLDDERPSQNTQAARGLLLVFPKNDPSLPPPRTAVVHFTGQGEATPGYVLASLFVALSDGKNPPTDGQLLELRAADIRAMEDFPWMVVDLADQMVRLGVTADQSLRLAQTDSISQLPNMMAAMSALESGLINARSRNQPLAVLLMDGDNLRRFNETAYEAGDEAIRLLGSTLLAQLRETDFLARWRTGDEFLALLSGTDRDGALRIAQRLRAAVEAASRHWLFPTTISIGVGVYPQHGQTVQDLLHAAEAGLKTAKGAGKNQVIVI